MEANVVRASVNDSKFLGRVASVEVGATAGLLPSCALPVHLLALERLACSHQVRPNSSNGSAIVHDHQELLSVT